MGPLDAWTIVLRAPCPDGEYQAAFAAAPEEAGSAFSAAQL